MKKPLAVKSLLLWTRAIPFFKSIDFARKNQCSDIATDEDHDDIVEAFGELTAHIETGQKLRQKNKKHEPLQRENRKDRSGRE